MITTTPCDCARSLAEALSVRETPILPAAVAGTAGGPCLWCGGAVAEPESGEEARRR